MARILGPDFVALQVRDLAAARQFYTDVLGFTEVPTSPPHAVVFATTPISFAIREPAVDLEVVSHLGWGVALWLRVDDANAFHEHLVAHNVPIVQAPFDSPFGRTFAFRDPDGYVITLHDGE